MNDEKVNPIERSIRSSKKREPGADNSVEARLKQIETLMAIITKRMDDVDFDIEDLFKKLEEKPAHQGDAVTFTDLRKFIASADKK